LKRDATEKIATPPGTWKLDEIVSNRT
jgi:hypothetical protein